MDSIRGLAHSRTYLPAFLFDRDTPTSAGPNSFGKTKHGFCNAEKVYEKKMAANVDTLAKDGRNIGKTT